MALDDILKLITGAGNDTIQPGPKNSILDSIRNQHLTTPVSQFVQVEQQNRPNMSTLDDPNVQKFLYALHKVEGGGDQFDVGVVHIPFNRGNLVTTSTARGAFQFIKSTRDAILRKYGVDAWSTDPKEQQMAAIYVLYDEDPEIINRIKSGDLKGAGQLVNAKRTEGNELFEGVADNKEMFDAAIDEGNQIKDVQVVNNYEENLIAKRKKLNEYANDGSYNYINAQGERVTFTQSTADFYTINAYDDVPESVNFTTTAPDLTVRDLSVYEDYYGEGTTIVNANGKDFILVPTDSGEPQQIPIQIANSQVDAGQAVIQGNEQEVATTTEESEGEYKITPLQEGDEVLELQPNFIDDLRSPEAGRADGTPLSDAEILAEIQKQAGDDIDVVEDENGKLIVIKKRPTSQDVQVVSGQDNPVPQPNVLDAEGDEVVSPVVPDTNTEEVVIDPNDGQEITTEEVQENNVEVEQEQPVEEVTLEQVQDRHGDTANIVNINGVDNVVYPGGQYPLSDFNTQENIDKYSTNDLGELPSSEIPEDADINQGVATWRDENGRLTQARVGDVDDVVTTEETRSTDVNIAPENTTGGEDGADGTGPGGTPAIDTDGDGVPDSLDPDSETVEVVNTDFSNINNNEEGGGDGNKRQPFKPNVPGVLSSIGGISSLVSALFAKKGLDEALKEVDVPNTPGLSQAFKRHFYESEQLAKSGMSLNEQDQVQKNIDQAYTQGIDKIVRGTSGDRAKFLAGLGVLDAQRNSSLLKAAALNDQIKRQNRQEYTKLLDFKETFEANKSEKERNEELKAALTKQSMYADLSGKAIKNIFDNMTAAKMYGKGSNYDNMMRMQMYNMGFDPPANSGLPSVIQNIVNSFSNNNNNNNNTQG